MKARLRRELEDMPLEDHATAMAILVRRMDMILLASIFQHEQVRRSRELFERMAAARTQANGADSEKA